MDHHHPSAVLRWCPACGGDRFPFKGRRFRCEACGFVFYVNTAAAVAGLIEDESGRLLLTVRAKDPKKGMLDLPGGFVEPGETAEAALRREIREELGIEIREAEYFRSGANDYTYKGLTYSTLDLAFVCRPVSFEGLKPADDVVGIVFLNSGEIVLEDVAFDSIRFFIREFIDRGAGST